MSSYKNTADLLQLLFPHDAEKEKQTGDICERKSERQQVTERRKSEGGQARGGRADERVEKDTEMNRQIDEDDEERDGDGPTPSKITDRHGDRPVSQSVSHIHSWPHYSARPHPDSHNGSSVCVRVYLCVCVPTHRAISRYSGPTGEPTPPPLPLHV